MTGEAKKPPEKVDRRKEKEREAMTNGNHIRSMNDEELAEFLCNMTYCCDCPHQEACNDAVGDGYFNWLQQKTKDEDNAD